MVRNIVLSLIFVAMMLQSCSSIPEVSEPLSSTPQPLPTLTPNPTFVSAPESSSGGEPSSLNCENDARFLDDLSFPDGEIVAPGQTIDKRWSVQNSGSCNWGTGYRLIHLGQDEFVAPEAVTLYPARADTNAVWQVDLKAPSETGQYISQWQAQAPDGTMFGDVVYILISVEKPTPTPTTKPLISSTPMP